MVGVVLSNFLLWSFRIIQLFVWSGFLLAWWLGMRHRLSMFGRLKDLLGPTLITTALAILLFDVWTGIIGWTLVQGVPLWVAFVGQVPFTLYHLTSFLFRPWSV